MKVVLWIEKNLKLEVLGEKKGRLGEKRLIVCKIGADKRMGQFSVRFDAVKEVDVNDITN